MSKVQYSVLLCIALCVALAAAIVLGLAVERWLNPSGASCRSLPTSSDLWPKAARELSGVAQFTQLAVTKGRPSDSIKLIVVCDTLFFLANDAYELHFDFVDQEIGLTHSRITFDRLAYFSTARTIINAQLTQLADDRFAFAFWPTDDMTLDNIVSVSNKLKSAAPWIASLVWVPGGELQRRRAAEHAAALDAARVRVQFSLGTQRDAIVYNAASSVGLLRLGEANQFDANSVVLFAGNAPPDISRVAGILSSNPQAPLSHTNVRAVHNHIPNAYLANAAARFRALLDQPVRFTATDTGQVTVEPATYAELNAANAARRAASRLVIDAAADLALSLPAPLRTLRAADAVSFGTKAANVGEMLRIGADLGADVPDGFALPFGMFNQHMTLARNSTAVRLWNVSESRPERQDVLAELVGDVAANDGLTTLWLLARRALLLRAAVNELVADRNATVDTTPWRNASVVALLVDLGPGAGEELILAVLRKAIRVAPVPPGVDDGAGRRGGALWRRRARCRACAAARARAPRTWSSSRAPACTTRTRTSFAARARSPRR
jgi:hypothetical protein